MNNKSWLVRCETSDGNVEITEYPTLLEATHAYNQMLGKAKVRLTERSWFDGHDIILQERGVKE